MQHVREIGGSRLEVAVAPRNGVPPGAHQRSSSSRAQTALGCAARCGRMRMMTVANSHGLAGKHNLIAARLAHTPNCAAQLGPCSDAAPAAADPGARAPALVRGM